MVWSTSDTKYLLESAYSAIRSVKNLDPIRDFTDILQNDENWEDYVTELSQGLTESDAQLFRQMSQNVRLYLLAEAFTQGFIKPYERLTLPILRVFWPTLVAKHLVHTEVMDAPEVFKYFLIPRAVTADGRTVNLPYWGGYNANGEYQFETLSQGPQIDINQEYTIDSNTRSVTINLKEAAGLSATEEVFCQRNIAIIAVGHTKSDGTVVWNTDVIIQPDVNGRIAQSVTIVDPSDGTIYEDFITGYFDVNECTLIINTTQGQVDKIRISGNISLATNKYLTRIELTTEKIYIKAEEYGVNTTFPVEVFQDVQRILDLDLQAELIQIMAATIANDIDTLILNDLYTLAKRYGAQDTFQRTRPANFYLGDLEWQRQIITKINKLSAAIQQATRIGRGNVLAMNPEDVALLESFNMYQAIDDGSLVGTDISISGGAPQIGKLQNRYLVVSSEKVPRGEVLMVLKAPDAQRAVYIFAEYIPLYFMPYPLSNIPSITLKYRAGRKPIRINGLAYLKITD